MNEVGQESGNPTMTEGRDLPWLQDTSSVDAWGLWAAEYRDVVLLDRDGARAGVYNLTLNDLADPANQEELRGMLESL